MSTALDLGRLILPAIRWHDDHGFAHEAAAIEHSLASGAGGFIVFGGTAEAVAALTADLRQRAGRPLLLAADLERGAGQQFDGLTQFPPPLALDALNDTAAIRWAAETTAREARSVGINWVFAPVADLDLLPTNPIVQTRAFGADPERVAARVRTWVAGCQAGGALACAKHYPGHGRTTADSHIALPVVDADAATLARSDLEPFRAAAAAGVAAMMTAHVAYPALDPSGTPATLSAPILSLLRRDGYDGIVVTDALIMDGALVGRSEGEAAVEALAAGADLLLYPNDPASVLAELRHALAEGRLGVARCEEALGRYARALAQAERPPAPPEPAPYNSSAALADALLERAMLRGAAPALRGPLAIATVDDDLGGPYPAVPTGHVRAALRRLGTPPGEGGSRVVLVFAEPRAWKGRSGLGDDSRKELEHLLPDAELVVLFAHPRLAAEIPGTAPILLAWHRQRLMQEAAARWLALRTG